jgi:hypothetical protein
VITLIVPGARTVWKAARLLVEGKFNMEKIIILTGDSQGNGRLIACLGMLLSRVRDSDPFKAHRELRTCSGSSRAHLHK